VGMFALAACSSRITALELAAAFFLGVQRRKRHLFGLFFFFKKGPSSFVSFQNRNFTFFASKVTGKIKIRNDIVSVPRVHGFSRRLRLAEGQGHKFVLG